jgi:hypothetical protein
MLFDSYFLIKYEPDSIIRLSIMLFDSYFLIKYEIQNITTLQKKYNRLPSINYMIFISLHVFRTQKPYKKNEKSSTNIFFSLYTYMYSELKNPTKKI